MVASLSDNVIISVGAGVLALACCFCVSGLARRHFTQKEETRAGRTKRRRRGGRSPQNRSGTRSPASPSARGGGAGADGLGPPSENAALLDTFASVLTDGLVMRLHGPNGKSKEVTVWLEGETLLWCSKRTLGGRWHKIPLRSVRYVEVGRAGVIFSAAPADVDPDRCLSLVLANSTTFDLEASSNIEREALAQGFSMLLASLRRGGGDEEQGSGGSGSGGGGSGAKAAADELAVAGTRR